MARFADAVGGGGLGQFPGGDIGDMDGASLDQIGDAENRFDANSVGAAGSLGSAPFVSPVSDYYLTNPITRASKTMAECSAVMRGANKVAAE